MERALGLSAPVLSISGLRLSRGAMEVLKGVDLALQRGELVALMGLSGCGKTTILRAVAALEPFQAGAIRVDGVPLHPGPMPREAALGELRRKVGLVFQLHCLFDHLSALDNVTLAPIHALRHSRAEAEARAHALLEGLGVVARARSRPRELSGGEAQRVAIARALAVDPPLLLMDEPTASLDPARRNELGDSLETLTTQGRTLLVATHDDDFARDYATRVVVLSDGAVVEDGPPGEVLVHPRHPATVQLLQSKGKKASSVRGEAPPSEQAENASRIALKCYPFWEFMAIARRLRQSILKDAIRENVDVIEERLPRGLRRSDRWRRLLFRTLVFVVVPLALFLSINALTTGRGERTDVLVVSSPSAAPAAPAINPPNGLEPSLFHLERGLIKQGSAKDEEAVHELLKHLISLAGKKDGQSVHAVVGVPAEALRVSRQHLRGAVKGIADALLIVSEPFAVAYGMDALLHTMVIDIGAGTTDFYVMNGHYPTEDDQRTLTHAGDSIDDQLLALVQRNIVLAGGGSQMPGLAAALEKSLAELGGGRVRAVEDPVFAGSNGGLAIALDAPEGDWEPLSA